MAEKVAAEEVKDVAKPPHAKKEVGGLPPEEGLEIFGPEPEIFNLSIGQVAIGPMKMGQIRKFMTHADKFLPALQEEAKKGEISMVKVMSLDQESFMKAVAVATDLTVEKLDLLTPDEFIRVISKVLVVNLDFFVRTLPKAIGGAEISVLNAVTKLVQDGAAKSKDLLRQGTA